MNVYLTMLGCRLNEAENGGWIREFEAQGHRVVDSPAEAQLVLLNTCAVTHEAVRKSHKLVRWVHRQNPDAAMVVTGCASELDPKRAAAEVGVDLVVPNGDKHKLLQLVESSIDTHVMPAPALHAEGAHAFREGRTRAFVKVQDGCRNRCTFCIVTSLRGEERSRSISDLVREVRLLVNRGFREVVLTGVHLGGYGSDCGATLSELTRAILADTDVERLRLSSLEPWDLPDDFHTLWESPRLMPHLHLPLQSGADTVLRRMARRCPTAQYRALVERLRDSITDLVITTDLIVGFPGETDAEWASTVDFVEEIGFGHMHIFGYSRREGTPAARMSGHVSRDVQRERSRQMHAIAGSMKSAALASFAGTERSILWEGEGELTEEGRHIYRGYTDNYLRVVGNTDAGARSYENRITRQEVCVATEANAAHLTVQL